MCRCQRQRRKRQFCTLAARGQRWAAGRNTQTDHVEGRCLYVTCGLYGSKNACSTPPLPHTSSSSMPINGASDGRWLVSLSGTPTGHERVLILRHQGTHSAPVLPPCSSKRQQWQARPVQPHREPNSVAASRQARQARRPWWRPSTHRWLAHTKGTSTSLLCQYAAHYKVFQLTQRHTTRGSTAQRTPWDTGDTLGLGRGSD